MRQGRVFVDTNVLLYMFDASDEAKRKRAIDTVRGLGGRMVVSAQVLQEFFWVATRKMGLNPSTIREAVRELCEGEVVPSTPALVGDAIDLAIVTNFTLWDALILQAAIVGRCASVLTEDLSHGRTVKGVRIENPFAEA